MKKAISYKNIWTVSYPIILSGVAQNIVNVTDTAFLGRYGMVELGAAGNAGIFYMVLMMVGLGFTIGCQIIIGRRNGEENYQEIGSLFNAGLYFLIPASVLLFVFVKLFSTPILGAIVASENILQASIDFLQVRAYGLFFALINFLFIAFYTGITKTKVLINATFIQAMVNVVLDYILIFGKFGLPEMGIKGAALASVISEIVALLYFMYYMKVKTDIRKYRLLEDFNFNLKKQARILKIAGPIMLQNFMALSTWLSFFMIIEQIGEQELAISHIIRSIYMVVMIPLFGFSSAASTLVSNLMGEKRVNEVTLLIRRIVALSVSTTAIFMPFLLLFPRQIISVYTTNLTLITGSMDLLPIICGAMLFFSIAFIVFSSVTGTGKTLVTLGIEFTSISIYLTTAYLCAIKYNQPLTIVWSTEFIYFGIMGLLAILYLKWGKWKNSTI
jgi:putative MATE family efflux protein